MQRIYGAGTDETMDIIWDNWPTILTVLVVFGIMQGLAGGLVYVERKICAFMQNRIGPNRVGPLGLLQILADGLKFIMKEEFIPNYADRAVFVLAPTIGFISAMLSFSVVPFGPTGDPTIALGNFPALGVYRVKLTVTAGHERPSQYSAAARSESAGPAVGPSLEVALPHALRP